MIIDDLEMVSRQLNSLPYAELSAGEEVRLIECYRAGEKHLSSLLYRFYAKKMIVLIRGFRNKNLWCKDLDIQGSELLSSATIVWFKTLSDYKKNKNTRFWTYSSRRIWYEGLLHFAREQLNSMTMEVELSEDEYIVETDWVSVLIEERDISLLTSRICKDKLDRAIMNDRILANQKLSKSAVAKEQGVSRKSVWDRENKLILAIKRHTEAI